MRVLNIEQGSDEWKAIRAKYFTASEASIMMGVSSVMKRNELLHQKKTLSEREFSEWFQRNILDKGHEIEALARPIAEKIIGEDLFPVVGVCDNDYLLASFDGLTMNERICWECKQWNEEKAAQVRAGFLPPDDEWQVGQQLVVSKAEKCLYMITDGTEERTVHLWVNRFPEDETKLMASWRQFEADLAAYIPTEEKAPIVARPVTDLPAVLVDVKGEIAVIDNFDSFEAALRDFIDNRLIKEPETDQDFADLETQIKSLKKAEDSLEAAEARMIAQVSAIDASKRRKDMLHELARSNRLLSEKLVKIKKENLKNKIVQGGQDKWTAHVATINSTLGGKITLPAIATNFGGVIKNLRTISSIQNAVDTELSRCKIEADGVANKIRLNLASLREQVGHEFLFHDAQTLVLKNNEDLVSLIKVRIAEHKAAEQKKAEAVRETIRQEEQAKAEKAAREKLEREQKEERDRLAAEKKPEPVVASEVTINRATQTVQPTIAPVAPTNRAPGASKPTRPPAEEIVDLVATTYGVDRATAVSWLKNSDWTLAA